MNFTVCTTLKLEIAPEVLNVVVPFLALQPLVENAVRHTPPSSPVLVQVSAVEDRVEIRVVDRGPGIPPEARERIFLPFQRYGDVPAGDGVGLGLAVARGLTEAMGGTLEAEDTPVSEDRGATLPGGGSPEAAQRPSSSPSTSRPGRGSSGPTR